MEGRPRRGRAARPLLGERLDRDPRRGVRLLGGLGRQLVALGVGPLQQAQAARAGVEQCAVAHGDSGQGALAQAGERAGGALGGRGDDEQTGVGALDQAGLEGVEQRRARDVQLIEDHQGIGAAVGAVSAARDDAEQAALGAQLVRAGEHGTVERGVGEVGGHGLVGDARLLSARRAKRDRGTVDRDQVVQSDERGEHRLTVTATRGGCRKTSSCGAG